jgi:hypothetical protein
MSNVTLYFQRRFDWSGRDASSLDESASEPVVNDD